MPILLTFRGGSGDGDGVGPLPGESLFGTGL